MKQSNTCITGLRQNQAQPDGQGGTGRVKKGHFSLQAENLCQKQQDRREARVIRILCQKQQDRREA